MKSRNAIMQETANFYFKNQNPVHITFKSGEWVNGMVKSILQDRLVLAEERFGEMLILFERIKDDGIQPRGEKK